MRTLAQKQNQLQKLVSSSLARPSMTTQRLHHRQHSIFHLQRTIGNQAVLRMLQTHAEEPDAGLTAATSPDFGHDFSQIPIQPSALLTLQRTVNQDFPEAPLKQTSKCPDGFTLKHRATWLRCDETIGTRRSGCAFCNNGKQESSCEEILKLLGNHRVIAPVEGRCGSKFQITTPRPGAPVIDVVKAEIPGGDTKLDINQDVITELGLDVETGRYDVCLKGPTGHDDRLVVSGGSACQKPSKPPEKRR